MKMKTTLVAAAVSSALCGMIASAAQQLPVKHQLANYDLNASQALKVNGQSKLSNIQVLNKLKRQESLNGSGITRISSSDHFDRTLNLNTFSWAKGSDNTSAIPLFLDRKSAIDQASLQFSNQVGLKHGVTTQAIQEAEVKFVHNIGRGAIATKYQQQANGIEVFGRQFNVLMNQDLQLVATTGYFAEQKAPKQPLGVQFKLPATDAINKALADIGADNVSMSAKGEKAKFQIFKAENNNGKFNFSDDPRSKKVYYPGAKKLIPAYYIELTLNEKSSKQSVAYSYVISAVDGEILNRNNMIHNEAFTYKVYADSAAPFTPFDSPMGNDLTPHSTGVYTDLITETPATMNSVTIEHSGISTGDAWLAAGATETNGNNVDAYADLDATDGFSEGDFRAQVTSAGSFEYTHTPGDAVSTEENVNAAIVNLFYVTNYLHDLYYDHGFDEASGNAQLDNYGRGGVEEDPLHVEAQDASGLNNANMSTPSDGFSPRMQMFLWSEGENTLNIGSLTDINYAASTAFGTQSFNVSANLIRLDDGDSSIGTINDGCQAAINANELAGNIAIVDRGDCAFTLKARNAQAAGAIAVIVANNDQDNPDVLVNMAGDDGADITIPAVFVSYNSGQAIYAELETNNNATTLALTLSQRDGTLDNAIVEHEWGHYISSRLTNRGMYQNSQGASMGEGWGDFFALMTMVREADQSLDRNDSWQGIYNDGGYAINTGAGNGGVAPYFFGLRRVPYTTDMEFNGLTFKHIEDQVDLPDHAINGGDFARTGGYNAEVHAAGEIWAVALWEAYAALLNRSALSFSEAQNRMMDYMVAGMKITPNSPTFTEARDAILAVAVANDVEDYNVMRDAFTKRGMGVDAVSPDRNDPGWNQTANSTGHAGVVEDFISSSSKVNLIEAVLDTQNNSVTGAFCDADNVLDVGETGAINFVLQNAGTLALSGISAIVSTTADVTFANDGLVNFADMDNWNDTVNGSVEVTLNSAGINDKIAVTITFASDDPEVRLPEDIEATFDVNRDVVKDVARIIEDFENLVTIENDWSQQKIGPDDSGYFVGLDDWTAIDVGFGTGNTMMGPDGRVATDISLLSPSLTVAATGAFAMDFSHYYELESSPAVSGGENVNWDGAVIEVSIDNGDWVDVITAGGSFATGYNGVINPGDEDVGYGPNEVLGGRDGFVDLIVTQWITPETLTFPEGVLNGHDVQFRFRIGTDASVGAWGWNIDDVQFTNATNPMFSSIVANAGVCVNRPPILTSNTVVSDEADGSEQATITLSVDTFDHDGDSTYSYQWTQLTGPSVTLSDATAASPTFVAPIIGADTTLTFSVAVTDADKTSTTTATVELTNVNSAPTLSDVTGTSTVEEKQSATITAVATDPENDDLTYDWIQTSGTSVSFSSTSSTLSFTAPDIKDDETLTFSVTASDGEYTTEALTKTVKVTNKKSGGGGSMGFISLLLAPLAFIRRRKQK